MSKHAVIFTGHSVHHVLDLYLEKAGLKKRIRHSCSDLSNLATLIFPPKLMGSEQANETKQCSKCSKIGPAWLKKKIVISFASPDNWIKLIHVSRLNMLIYILL